MCEVVNVLFFFFSPFPVLKIDFLLLSYFPIVRKKSVRETSVRYTAWRRETWKLFLELYMCFETSLSLSLLFFLSFFSKHVSFLCFVRAFHCHTCIHLVARFCLLDWVVSESQMRSPFHNLLFKAGNLQEFFPAQKNGLTNSTIVFMSTVSRWAKPLFRKKTFENERIHQVGLTFKV